MASLRAGECRRVLWRALLVVALLTGALYDGRIGTTRPMSGIEVEPRHHRGYRIDQEVGYRKRLGFACVSAAVWDMVFKHFS
jgi:hypothetical protein